MIKSIKSKKIKLFIAGNTSKVDQSHIRSIQTILTALSTATCLNDVDLKGRRLHSFKEKVPTVWSLDVSGNWRITFEILGSDIYNINYVDTH